MDVDFDAAEATASRRRLARGGTEGEESDRGGTVSERSESHPAIDRFRNALSAIGPQPVVGPMSTTVTGEGEALFAELREAFLQAAASEHVVVTLTVSNACPI